MTIGVYAVVNRHNGKAYIGSSSNVSLRLIKHKSSIKTKSFLHYQGYKDDAIKHGVDAFEFKVLCETESIEEAREIEEAVISLWKEDFYNKSPSATGSSGVKRDRLKYIAGAAKRLKDPEFTKKLSEACKGQRKIVQCPHCGLEGGGGNMRRYHFEKCEHKK